MALSYPGRLDIATVCLGYLIALAVLLAGALVQLLIARRPDALWTLGFFTAGLLLFATLSPWDLIAT